MQDFSYLARKASFLVQDLQDFVQDLASLARKILARSEYFLQDGFYWEVKAVQFMDTSSAISHAPFRSPVKEKGKQERMERLTRAQWINFNRNNRSMLANRYSVL